MAASDAVPQRFSLTEAVENIRHRFSAQTESLRENQETLSSLQETLSDTRSRAEASVQQLGSTEREILVLQLEVENLQRENKAQSSRCLSLSKENVDLQIDTEEEEDNAHLRQAGFNTYRNKMEAHREAVCKTQSRTGAYRDLQDRRTLVLMLRQKKEELRMDLEDPHGNSVQQAKREVDALKVEICDMTKITAEKTERLRGECETQAQIQKDTQIHTKRHEAIVKRLRCKLSRAQASRRQAAEEIHHMKLQLAELKRQKPGDRWSEEE